MAASDIPLAREALKMLRAGTDPGASLRAALARVDAIAGASRPLSDYAPRTQRRFLAAAALGVDAKTANRIDTEQKRHGSSGTSFRERIEDQAQRNADALGDGGLGAFDEEQLDVFIDMMGLRGALAILRMQWDSIQEYKAGNSDPAQDRWARRPDIIERYKKGFGHDDYMTPYFFYRARR